MPAALPALLRRLSGPKQRRRTLSEISRGESLETRVLPAAVATVSKATLNITGDVDGGDLQIEQVAGGVKVSALNGTALRIDGLDVVNGSLTFSGVTSMNVRLGAGDDSVAVLGTLNLKNVSIDLGDGDNSLSVGAGLNVSTKLTIDGGTGKDQVTLNGTVAKTAAINLDLGNDEVTLRGGAFSGAMTINTSAGADVVDIDEISVGAGITFNNNLTISTGEDNDTVSIRNATTKKVTVNTGDDDDTVTLDTVTANGLLSINTSAGADDLNLLTVNATVNGANQLTLGTGADDVVISRSAFQGNVNLDLGTGIVNTLKVDDTDFRGTVGLNANGGVDIGGVGDRISIETDTALAGTTTFRKAVKAKVGAAAFVTLGADNVNSNVDFLSTVAFTGINPAARLDVWVGATSFVSVPSLAKVNRFNLGVI